MTTPSPNDDLEPRLAAAESELFDHLEEACSLEPEKPGDENTGELLRLEEVLDAARAAAERAVELRRERRARQAGAEAVGVREFTDEAGREWRVWLVIPSGGEEHRGTLKRVGSQYEGGWLAFETFDGAERRRLPDYPDDWQDRHESRLADLLNRAAPVAQRRRRSQAEPDERDSERAD